MKFDSVKYWLCALLLAVVSMITSSCNMDEELTAVAKPVIEFDHSDGIYSVVCGEELTLSPVVENGEDAEYIWTIDGEVVGHEPEWTRRWDTPGEYYVLLTVRNAGGTDREEVRIDVAAVLPPVISLAIANDFMQMQRGTSYSFRPLIGNLKRGEAAAVEWFVNDQLCGTGEEFLFDATENGSYRVEIVATASGGEARKVIDVEVLEQLPASVSFVPLSMMYGSVRRVTVPGRPVALQLAARNVGEDIVWSVNGERVAASGLLYVFSAEACGTYVVTAQTGNAMASITVDVREVTSKANAATASSAIKVLEWMPAPGQFIGETSSVGGMTDDIVDHEQACAWASERLAHNHFVSLGAWGGYIVMSLDGAVYNRGGDFDFAIMGNAVQTSNEPGIVWVMQDVNGNGLPDDEWYELRGSDFNTSGTDRAYAATYYRPAGAAMAVQWTDGYGGSGIIDYIGGTHNQPTYYPAWVMADSYTLYGTRLAARNSQNPVTGHWSNEPFGWGYVDNLGSDLLGGDTDSGLGQWVGFRISNAVLPNGESVSLDCIDFVKVQTGVMARSGNLGELSTEVCGFKVM